VSFVHVMNEYAILN